MGLVQEHVGRLQDRVGEQPDAHGLGVALGSILELDHPAELAHPSDARKDPLELGVFGDVRLDEERGALGVDPTRQELGRLQPRSGEDGTDRAALASAVSEAEIAVEAARAELESRGVTFVPETMDSGVCHMAYFSDPDGNALMLHHRYAPPGERPKAS